MSHSRQLVVLVLEQDDALAARRGQIDRDGFRVVPSVEHLMEVEDKCGYAAWNVRRGGGHDRISRSDLVPRPEHAAQARALQDERLVGAGLVSLVVVPLNGHVTDLQRRRKGVADGHRHCAARLLHQPDRDVRGVAAFDPRLVNGLCAGAGSVYAVVGCVRGGQCSRVANGTGATACTARGG